MEQLRQYHNYCILHSKFLLDAPAPHVQSLHGRKTARALEATLKVSLLVADRPFTGDSKPNRWPILFVLHFLLLISICVGCTTFSSAQVTSISIQAPGLSSS